jgi:hypothetical protein
MRRLGQVNTAGRPYAAPVKAETHATLPEFSSIKQLVGWALHKHHARKSSVQISQAWLRLSKVVCYYKQTGLQILLTLGG